MLAWDDELAAEPLGPRALVVRSAPAAHGARVRQPRLADALRPRHRRTSEDFGAQGAIPTHPELLDWLAVEFMESGWDVKALHRLIVTSATYRQGSNASDELLARDAANALYTRGPRWRMTAEMVRDGALKASGLLAPTSADRASNRISPQAFGIRSTASTRTPSPRICRPTICTAARCTRSSSATRPIPA